VITGHAQVSGIRPSRLFFVAQLVVVKMSRSRMRRGDLLFQMRRNKPKEHTCGFRFRGRLKQAHAPPSPRDFVGDG
jgi:hypothetical protein